MVKNKKRLDPYDSFRILKEKGLLKKEEYDAIELTNIFNKYFPKQNYTSTSVCQNLNRCIGVKKRYKQLKKIYFSLR